MKKRAIPSFTKLELILEYYVVCGLVKAIPLSPFYILMFVTSQILQIFHDKS